MPNIATLGQVRALLYAYDTGATIRDAAAFAGVAKATASRYRAEWMLGPSDAITVRDRVMAATLASRKTVTRGRYKRGTRPQISL